MRDGEYGLGIDIGDGTVSAAVCGTRPGGSAAEALPLGDPGNRAMARVGVPVPVYAGDVPVAAEDLVAAAVQRVREHAARDTGSPDAWTVVTVPPSWTAHRRDVLARALEAAGVPRFSLVSAAVAAVHHHVTTGDLPAEPTVAVYDLGAGTLDTAVVGPTAEEPLGHLAVPPAPLPWGGRDVDDLVLGLVRPHATVGAPEGARALRAVCVEAKEALSTETAVPVDLGQGSVRVTREELDELLDGPARASAAVLRAAIAAAGVDQERLDAVVLAGGGVRVPLVAEVLSGELGRPLVVGPDPRVTAALGAAALAAGAIAAEALAPIPAGAVELPAGEPALLAVEGPVPVPRAGRRPRGGAGRPAPRPTGSARNARLRRGAVVTGAFLGIVLLPPTLAGVLGVGGTAAPAGHEQAGTVAGERDVEAAGPAGGDGTPAPLPPAAGTPTGGSGAGGAGRVPATDPGAGLPGRGLAGALSEAAARNAAAPERRIAPSTAPRPTAPRPPAAPAPGSRAPTGPAPAPTSSPVPGTPAPTPAQPPTPPPSGTPVETPGGTPSPTPSNPPPGPPVEEPPTETPGGDPPPADPPATDPPAGPAPEIPAATGDTPAVPGAV
ncbi:Hsp70 family protein [Geodermatophilus sp. CPCC 206100]|uniref:Hsp70 family protein n=1 Tax=Geodermatophilus sp. CPCC 206100 TaxID=3020054 RepID=UPI003B0016C8